MATSTPTIVAQPAEKIAGMAGFGLPEGKRFFIVPETGAGPDYPFSGEKLSVTMALYRAKDIDEAIALTNAIQAYQGQGHSCGIYSNSRRQHPEAGHGDQDQPRHGQPAAGAIELGQPVERHAPDLFSLGCGSWGGNATNNNITWADLINVTWVSKNLPTPKELPSDEELFGKDIMAELAGIGL